MTTKYVSYAVRGFMTVVGIGSSIMTKMGPEIGVTAEMSGMDSRKMAEGWTRVSPWKELNFPSDGVALRYFCLIFLLTMAYNLWNAPKLGSTMWLVFFGLADWTCRQVGGLTNPSESNPNCPSGAGYCDEVLYTHVFLFSMGAVALLLEFVNGDASDDVNKEKQT